MWRWHTSGDVPALIEDGRFILVPVGTGSSSRHTPSMVFHDCDVFVISRTWSITWIIVTNHKERGGFGYIPISSTGPPSQEKWYTLTAVISGWSILKQKSTPIMWRLLFDFNGCVITPLLKISNFYLLVLLGTEVQCQRIDRWIILGVCVLFQVWCVGNCHMKWFWFYDDCTVLGYSGAVTQ